MSTNPYAYKGGGYWRDDDVPPGERAHIVHGDQALEIGRWEMVAEALPYLEDLRARKAFGFNGIRERDAIIVGLLKERHGLIKERDALRAALALAEGKR